MNALKPTTRFKRAEYLAIEEVAERKHEYLDGQILDMAGAGRDHNRVVAQLIHVLMGKLGGGPCVVFPSDLRLDIEETGDSFYPDVQVVCGTLLPEGQKTGLTNPTVIVEVLSESTEEYDRAWKLPRYRSIPSVRDIVLVDLATRSVEHHARNVEGAFDVRSGPVARLVGIDAEIRALDLFAGIDT